LIAAILAVLDKKVTTYYLGPVIDVCLKHWFPITDEHTPIDFPKSQLVQEKEKKIPSEQSR
jgi:hypothetical protein